MKNKFTYTSLCSGVGGFETALNSLGGECVFASEIDTYAQKSYTALYGNDVLHGDITKVDARDIPKHDLLVAGIPCQSFSVNGKRGGFEDARGTLFFDVARVAQHHQPKAILIENVKGLIGHEKGKTIDTMVKVFNDIGYRVDFEVLNSKYFGVPQNRERIFLIAVREDLVKNEVWSKIEGKKVALKGKQRIVEYEGVKTFNFNFPQESSVTTTIGDILESDADESFYLPDNVFNQLMHTVPNHSDNKLLIKEAVKKGYSEAYIGDAVNFRFPTSKTRRGRVGANKLANTIEAAGVNQGVVTKDLRIRRFTPLEYWRLQGFTDEQHELVELAGLSNNQRYKQAGNAVTVSVVKAIGEELLKYIL